MAIFVFFGNDTVFLNGLRSKLEKKGHVCHIRYRWAVGEWNNAKYDYMFAEPFVCDGSFVKIKERHPQCRKLDYLTIEEELSDLLVSNNVVEKSEPKSSSASVALASRNIKLERSRIIKDNLRRKESFFVGKSEPYIKLTKAIKRVAALPFPVIVEGSTGTGKEHTVREIHEASGVKGSLVSCDCGCLTQELALSDLFGHEKGAFTGAYVSKQGLVFEAVNGTLFLDEVENLHPAVQIALLRAIQEKVYRRVGGNDLYEFKCRVICATNVNLEKLVEEGKFRQDLYFRIKGAVVKVPALEEVLDDIPDLIKFLVSKHSLRVNSSQSFISKVMDDLYPFKGNVRELLNYLMELSAESPTEGLSGIELMQYSRV